MADVHAKLDELSLIIEAAKAMPLSASCVVNRAELLAVVGELRELLPAEMDAAARIVAERARVVDAGRREADRLVAEAHAERNRLLADTDTGRDASAEADRILLQAREAAASMRREIDQYVDTKLAGFEVVLQRTLGSVSRGRAKLAERSDFAPLVEDDGADSAAPSLADLAPPAAPPPAPPARAAAVGAEPAEAGAARGGGTGWPA